MEFCVSFQWCFCKLQFNVWESIFRIWSHIWVWGATLQRQRDWLCMSPQRSILIQTQFTLFLERGDLGVLLPPKLPYQQNGRVVVEGNEDLGSNPASDATSRWVDHSISLSGPQLLHLCNMTDQASGCLGTLQSEETPHIFIVGDLSLPVLCLWCCPEAGFLGPRVWIQCRVGHWEHICQKIIYTERSVSSSDA